MPIRPCRHLLLLIAFILSVCLKAQTVITMEKVNGVFMIPCEVNGLSLRFVFDTGASDVSISLTEALFMLKNGYLKEADLLGTEYYRLANGDIQEGTRIKLRIIRLGGIELRDVEASVVHTSSAPLLLGQTALRRLGKVQFDFIDGTMVILNGKPSSGSSATASAGNSGSGNIQHTFTGKHLYMTTLAKGTGNVPVRPQPEINAEPVAHCQAGNRIYVLDLTNEIYAKVHVNGQVGYISKAFLARQQ